MKDDPDFSRWTLTRDWLGRDPYRAALFAVVAAAILLACAGGAVATLIWLTHTPAPKSVVASFETPLGYRSMFVESDTLFDLVVILPSDTSDEQDRQVVGHLADQARSRGKFARITVCIMSEDETPLECGRSAIFAPKVSR